MAPFRAFVIPLLAIVPYIAATIPSQATPLSVETVALTVRHQQEQTAELDYRVAPGVMIDRVTVASDDVPMPVSSSSPYPWKGAVTAVLFLIDTSASRRVTTVQRNLRDLARMVTEAAPRQQIGLAVFDSDMQALAPLGVSRDRLLEAMHGISAKGQTTELFRCAREAIALLAKTAADRRALVILSDGGAEDTAYRSELAGYGLVVRRRRTRAGLPQTFAYLDFLDSDARMIPTTTTQVTIGRRDDNDLQLGNDTISEHHAVIRRRRDGVFEILDLASTNGVAVNESRVQHIALTDGDLITLGEVRLRFRLSSERTS